MPLSPELQAALIALRDADTAQAQARATLDTAEGNLSAAAEAREIAHQQAGQQALADGFTSDTYKIFPDGTLVIYQYHPTNPRITIIPSVETV